jgi:hypothetical protein
MKKHLLICICLMFVISACGQSFQVVVQATKTVVSSRVSTAPSQTPKTPSLVAPSIIPSRTATSTSTPQPTSTVTPTWTPRPTLPPDQAQAYGLKIFKTNGNCLLPCWIGLSPGKTTWNEAYSFLAIFADYVTNDYPLSLTQVAHFKFPDTSYRGVSETGATISIRDGIIDQIRTPEDISLSNLLTTYGAPTEIRIWAIGYGTADPVGRFTLVLFYQDQGIMAVYEGINEKAKTIHICPNHIQGPQLTWLLWAPADRLTFAEAGRKTLLISDPPPPAESDYIPLETLANLSIDAFTQRYKDPKNKAVCMEMPAPDWP